jgi:predicted acyl esterase
MPKTNNQSAGPNFKIKMKIEKNVMVPTRDGTRMAVDIFRPDASGKFPALLGMSPYGKAIQTLPYPFPQPAPDYTNDFKTALWDGNIEAGPTEEIVARGYAHVIGDLRGMGDSEGDGTGDGEEEGRDYADVVEWLAKQPWCDGNIGGIGMSYFAMTQVAAALEQPPHLKAIAPFFFHERVIARNGIINPMHFWLYDGRDGTSGYAPKNPVSKLVKTVPKADLDKLVQNTLDKNPDLWYDARLWKLLIYPNKNPLCFDDLVEQFNTEYFGKQERPNYRDKIKIPVLLGSFGPHSGFNIYIHLKSPKKLVMWSPQEYEPRPWRTGIDVVLRWYDYWLKGLKNGIMDEAPIKLFLMGANQWRDEYEWPLSRTKNTEYYLRTWERLSPEPEVDNDFPDSYLQEPIFVSARRGGLKYLSAPLPEDLEVTGNVVVYLYAAIDQDDTNFRVKLTDVNEAGVETTSPHSLTEAWLRASFRGLDKKVSTPNRPVLTGKQELVVPGEINEYAFTLPEISNVFKAGHRIKLEIFSMNSGKDQDAHTSSYVLSISRPTVHKIYRDAEHRSRVILPVIPKS